MQIDKLINLADSVLSSDTDSPALEQLLNDYSIAFAAWYEANKAQLKSVPQDLTPEAKQTLGALEAKHSAIITLAGNLLESSRKDLISFRKHSKGLMTYADVLPKRVSFSKVRKG